MGKPLIVFDGQEDLSGRALFCISSLYFAQPWLATTDIRFIDVDNPDVSLALGACRWDLGIEIDERKRTEANGPAALSGALIYAGAAFRSASRMRLSEARALGVVPVVMIQYPDESWLSASTLLHMQLAFDPDKFARHLGAMIARLS